MVKTTFNSSKLMVGSKMLTVTNISAKEGGDLPEEYPVGIHFIQVIDRSGSMSGSIKALAEHVIQTAAQLRVGDYLTALWFSGSGDHGTILKMFKITGPDDEKVIATMVRKYASTRGCTVFSETLAELEQIIEETKDLVTGTAITWFTDGQLVPSHQSFQAERSEVLTRCSSIAKLPGVLAIDTIGYGPYYDKDLLEKMAGMTKFGTLTHSSKIDEYMAAYSAGVAKVTGLVPVGKITIENPSRIEVMFLSDKGTFFSTEPLIEITSISKRDNKIITITGADFAGSNLLVTTEGEDAKTIIVPGSPRYTDVNPRSVEKLLYGYAAKCYQIGKRDEALDIFIGVIGDGPIVKAAMDAFSVTEVGEAINLMNSAYVYSKNRNPGTVDPNIVDEDAPCFTGLMDVLERVDADEDKIFVDVKSLRKAYKRVGVKQVEAVELFAEDANADCLVAVGNIAYAKDRLNVYVNAEIKGFVKLLPAAAKKVGLPAVFETSRHKSYNLIVDGMWNISCLPLKAKDAETWKELRDNLIGLGYPIMAEENDLTVTVTTAGIPMTNRGYSKRWQTFKDLTDLIIKDIDLQYKQKVINYFIDKKSVEGAGAGKLASFTPEQVQVLMDHGVDRLGRFGGVRATGEDKPEPEFDYITVRNMVFSVEGHSSLPKVEDCIGYRKKNEGKSRVSASKLIMSDAYDSAEQIFADADLSFLLETRRTIKIMLADVRSELAVVKFVKACTGGWFTDLPLEDGDKNYSITAPNGTTVTVGVTYRKTRVDPDYIARLAA